MIAHCLSDHLLILLAWQYQSESVQHDLLLRQWVDLTLLTMFLYSSHEFNVPSSLSSYGRVSIIQVRHKKRMGTEGLSFYHPNLMCCLNQMLAVIKLSQHLVLSSKTARPIIPQGAQCMGHIMIMWSAICSLAPRLHFAKEARSHLCMDEPKRRTPVRRRLSLIQAVLVKLIPIGLVLTLDK